MGIYGYRGDILKKWKDLPFSPLENLEKLEQLRLIEAGIEFGSFEVKGEFLSVDTEEQLEEGGAYGVTYAVGNFTVGYGLSLIHI